MTTTTPDASSSTVRAQSTYAFNIYLSAYDDGIADESDRKLGRFFQVGALEKFKMSDKRTTLGKVDEDDIPSLVPKEEETNFNVEEGKAKIAVWVGMRPSNTFVEGGKDNDGDEQPSMGDRHATRPDFARGTSVASLKKLKVIETDRKALRVVCPVLGGNANYYALFRQDKRTGLCTGVHISIDEVFFFPEFRDDDITSIQDRKTAWAAKVREQCNDPKKKDTMRNYDKTKFTVGRKRSLAAEIYSMGVHYELTGDETHLQNMNQSMKSVDPDLRTSLIERNTSLCKLIEGPEMPTLEQCAEALGEVNEMWPKVGAGKTPEYMMEVARCVRAGKVVLPYKHIRLFLVEAARAFQTASFPLNDKVAERITEKIVAHIELLVGGGGESGVLGPTSAVEHTFNFTDFVETEGENLTELANLFQIKLTALKDSQGEHAVAGSLPQIWQEFGDNLDKDSAKNMAAHLHRFNAIAIADTFSELEQMLRKKGDSYASLAKTLRDVADTGEEDE